MALKHEKMSEIKNRLKAKTPKFWKKVTRIGLVATAIGTTLLTAPIGLPVALVTFGGYLVTAGGVTAALAQLTKEDADTESGRE